MTIQSFRDLEVWRLAVVAVGECYQATRVFPSDERYGLSAQMRRAAVSVASNIAEGHGTGLRRRYAYHVAIARGSVTELQTQFAIARRLGFIGPGASELDAHLEQLSRMLLTLRRRLE